MSSKSFHVLGIMSGTSLDGIDVVRVRFGFSDAWNFKILEAKTHPYPEEWHTRLTHVMELSQDQVDVLDQDYTQYLGQLLKPYVSSSLYPPLDFVSSHGHTVFHQPQEGLTLQIGNLPQLAKILQCKVICDFRVADVALGGQGAPLVPGGEVQLFSSYAACLNLGGFANVSILNHNPIKAYDLCGVNIVLNHWANQLGLVYDAGGQLARKGKPLPQLKDELDRLPFYHQAPPKSLGKEWVLNEVLPLMERYVSEGIPNLLHTYVLHIAEVIAAHLPKDENTLVTGGGAYHDFLIASINQKLANPLVLPSKTLIEFKEALIFAFLGVLRHLGESNCLASVTGASKDHSSGKIFEF